MKKDGWWKKTGRGRLRNVLYVWGGVGSVGVCWLREGIGEVCAFVPMCVPMCVHVCACISLTIQHANANLTTCMFCLWNFPVSNAMTPSS